MAHSEAHPLAGKTVKIKEGVTHPQLEGGLGGTEYRLEDWWDRIAGKGWGFCEGNPACLIYALRIGTTAPDVPRDDEVVYGKIGCFGHLFHISELTSEVVEPEETSVL